MNLTKDCPTEIWGYEVNGTGSYHRDDLFTHSIKTVEYAEEALNNIKVFLPEYTEVK